MSLTSRMLLLAAFVAASCAPSQPPPDPRIAKCESAERIVLDRDQDLRGTRRGAGKAFEGSNQGPCVNAAADDVVYALEVPKTVVLSAEMENTQGWGTLQLRRDCTVDEDVACGNQTSTLSTHPAHFTTTIEPGTWFLIVDAENAAADESYVVHLRLSEPFARERKCAAATTIPTGVKWVHDGGTVDGGYDFRGSPARLCDDGFGADEVFHLSATTPLRVTATEWADNDWGMIELRNGCPEGETLACGNEQQFLWSYSPASFDVGVPAGEYSLILDSENGAGTYSLRVNTEPYTPIADPLNCGNPYVLGDAGLYGAKVGTENDTVLSACGRDGGGAVATMSLQLKETSDVALDVSDTGSFGVSVRQGSCTAAEVTCGTGAFHARLDAGTYVVSLHQGDSLYTLSQWFLRFGATRIVANDGGTVTVPDAGTPDAGTTCACGPGEFCNGTTCQSCSSANRCGPGCTACTGAQPYCNAAGTACVACTTSGQCALTAPCCTSAGVCQLGTVGCL